MRELVLRLGVGRSTLGVGRVSVASQRSTSNPEGRSAIFPLIIGDERAAMDLANCLQNEGFLVPAIRYPIVAKGAARLRITVTAAHQEDQIRALCETIKRRAC